jgi:hypothetical protein
MEPTRNCRTLHELLVAAVARAAELHDTSLALEAEHRVLTRELQENVTHLREKRRAMRARRRPDR